jgi:NAD(P)-dependent dehydrogenase (short-subunit alcohol dehydrogenase family)
MHVSSCYEPNGSKNNMSTSKKTIIITGAGSGIGQATAIKLSLNPSIILLLVGRRMASLEATLSMCQHQGQHRLLAIDVRDGSQWKVALAAAQDELKNCYALFANAGVGGENHYGEGDRWDEIISTNLTGTYVTIMECLPYMQARQHTFAHILITSSCLARFGVPRYTAYCAAKEGLLGLTKSLAVEHARNRILVNAICPGWVETEMAQAGIKKLAEFNAKSYESAYDEQMGYVPTGKMSQPAEIASFVDFMFSEQQVSITGQGLDINNGSFML